MLLLFPLLRSGGRPRALPFEFCGLLGALAPFRCTGLLCLLRGFTIGADLFAPPRRFCKEEEEGWSLSTLKEAQPPGYASFFSSPLA